MTLDTENSNTENAEPVFKDDWMVRPCKAYLAEYKDCRSIKARFHQHFIYGQSIDCSQWRRDYDNCMKWKDDKDLKAANEVVKSETERRMQRLRGHYGNTVWEKREAPPEDWDKPLPEYLQKEYEHTYLNLKSKELRGEPVPDITEGWSICVLM